MPTTISDRHTYYSLSMSRFNPYGDSSGGSSLAIAGADFAILAGDTRHSTGFAIDSRDQSQIADLGDGLFLTSNGFSADAKQLVDDLRTQIKWYHHNNNDHKLSISAAARTTMMLLYGKRFFPYYVNPIMIGMADDGTGAVYSFDPLGSYDREPSRAAGHASELLMPFLDNQVTFANQLDPQTGEPRKRLDLDLQTAVDLVKDAFTGAAERQVQVGDTLEIVILTKDGVDRQYYDLRRD